MNSKDIFEKIIKRNKYVSNCGTARNYAYLEYSKASLEYDSTKKGFYTALQLARHDGNIQEDHLQRYEHLLKHFDKQLLNQLKDREYDVLKCSLENDETTIDAYNKRFTKIENTGYLRNQFHFDFVDSKNDLVKAKGLFYDEISLAVRDGLITDIDEKRHIESIKKIEIKLDEEMAAYRRDFIKKREGEYYRGNGGPGRGHVGRVRGHDGRCRRHNVHSIGRSFRCRGRNGRVMKQSFKGRRNDWLEAYKESS